MLFSGRAFRRVESLENRRLLAADPIISEFMASNRDTLFDAQSPPVSSDWIEIFNRGDESINLQGWYLTDDPDDLNRWQFPHLELAPGQFEVVFASGRSTPDTNGSFHTNFRLRAAGEFLALVKPNGTTIASQFGSSQASYPRQVADVSFGQATNDVETKLVSQDAVGRILIPEDQIPADWTTIEFDDNPTLTHWSDVTLPVGYGGGEPQLPLATTNVESLMRDRSASALVRIPFEVEDPRQFENLAFDVAYDDGFIALINGHAIASANAPDLVVADSTATEEHDALGETFQVHPDRRSIWYSFEEDGGQIVTDKLVGDGAQNPEFNSGGSVDTRNSRAAFGERSLRLPGTPGPAEFFNRLQIPNTRNLGDRFTLSAHVNLSEDSLQRLYSNYNGTGPIGAERLLFDVDPSGTAIPGIRLAIGNRGVVQTEAVPASLLADGYHHFAATYDDGEVQLFVDGVLEATGTLGSGPLVMPLDLYFGEDPHDEGGTDNEQLSGNVDEILVLAGEVLLPGDIELLSASGANALLHSERKLQFVRHDVSDALGSLVPGSNVLAIHALNVSPNDDDFFIAPRLIASTPSEKHPPGYFVDPTPRVANDIPLSGLVDEVSLDQSRGFYESPFEVTLATSTPGAVLAYTTDGSEPSLNNGVIVAPTSSEIAPRAALRISTTTNLRVAAFKDDFVPTQVQSASYLFLQDVIRQPRSPEGYPNRWGRARADYEMDPEIVDTAPYSETILDDLKSIPTVSLSLEHDDFFGPDGIYSNTLLRGRDWERPTSVEYFDPSKTESFQIDAGVRVHGGFSRDPSASPQHSLRLHFRSMYGEGKLRFPLFPDTEVAEFDSLVLNAQSSDNWSSINTITGRVAQFTRDQWAQDMQREMGHEHVPGKFVHLYINGLYWGLYGLMERPDDDFAAAHFGGYDEDFDVIVDENANSGNLSAWNDLLSRVRAEDYAGVQQLLDIDNFIDYMILNIYMGNWDWPDHNWNAIRRRAEGERFTFLVWDAEVGLGLDTNVPGPIRPRVVDVDLAGRRRDVGRADVRNGPGEIYDGLRTIPEFQLRFADRLHQHLFNDGALTSHRAAAVFADRANEIESALVGQAARWGDVRRRTPDVPDGVWAEERDWILESFFVERPAIVLEDFRDESLYPSIEAPVFNRHGGIVSVGFPLQISHQNLEGTIYYTLDGSDPRVAGGAVSPTAVSFVDSFPLTEPTTVSARVLKDGMWSALTQAGFVIGELAGDITGDGFIDHDDIAVMCQAVRSGDGHHDIDNNGAVNLDDLYFFVETLLATSIGDANLDGRFDSQDFVLVFQAGTYDDPIAGNSTWLTGDWNCDGEFNSNDFVLAFQRGTYDAD